MAQTAKKTARSTSSRSSRTRTAKKASVSPIPTTGSTSGPVATSRVPTARVPTAPAGRAVGLAGAGNGRLLGAAESDITDELQKGGPAFGSFVGAVGAAVADAQAKLDKTFIETAQALSREKIKVVAVFEQVIDDDGRLTQGNIHESELPLVNFITPTAYKWSKVFLRADMQVSEFSGTAGFRIQGRSTSFGASARASYGLFGGFSAGTSFSTSSFDRSVSTESQTDNAAGQLHMEATLEPRDDVRPPQPFILQKGPTLKLLVDRIEDITGAGGGGGAPAPVIGRKATIRAELKKTDGSGNNGKSIDTTLSESGLSVTSTGQTDANGVTTFVIERRNPVNDGTPGNPVPFVIRAQFGLVTDSVGLTL